MLYLVATPIGNLGDITLRALETLRSVDLIASEDTRKTGLLLKRYDIEKPQLSFHEYNEERAGERIMALLAQGQSVALVTNAGTPGISDPGFTLVRRAIAANVPVTMIPGPSAFVMALVLSGLPVHGFTFRGFPPRKPGPRRRFLAVDADSPHTLIFYESPYRLVALLQDAIAVYGDRPAALTNDLTKMFESVDRCTLSELLERVRATEPRGEYTLVIAGAAERSSSTAASAPAKETPTQARRRSKALNHKGHKGREGDTKEY
jgi:16S rRNA (cytidine1402-2'-O)-methyltransferase